MENVVEKEEFVPEILIGIYFICSEQKIPKNISYSGV